MVCGRFIIPFFEVTSLSFLGHIILAHTPFEIYYHYLPSFILSSRIFGIIHRFPHIPHIPHPAAHRSARTVRCDARSNAHCNARDNAHCNAHHSTPAPARSVRAVRHTARTFFRTHTPANNCRNAQNADNICNNRYLRRSRSLHCVAFPCRRRSYSDGHFYFSFRGRGHTHPYTADYTAIFSTRPANSPSARRTALSPGMYTPSRWDKTDSTLPSSTIYSADRTVSATKISFSFRLFIL